MYTISTEIEIESAPLMVREKLMDFDGHARWNPFFKSIKVLKGDRNNIKPGDSLEVSMQSGENGSITKFTPTVVRNEPSLFEWKGALLTDWIFAGTHSFQFIELDGGNKTKFVQSEVFTGSLVFALKYFLRDTPKNFTAMNSKLKEECEKMN